MGEKSFYNDFIQSSRSPLLLIEVKTSYFKDGSNGLKRKLDKSGGKGKLTLIINVSEPFKKLINYTNKNSCLFDYVSVKDIQKLEKNLTFVLEHESENDFGWRFSVNDKLEAVMSRWHHLNDCKTSGKLYFVEILPININLRVAKELSLRKNLELEVDDLKINLKFERKNKKKLQIENKKLSESVNTLYILSQCLSQSNNLLLWKISSENGEINFVNEKGSLNLLKYKSEDLIGQNYFDSIHFDDVNSLKEAIQIGRTCIFRRCSKFGKYIKMEAQTKFLDSNKQQAIILESLVL